MNDRSTPPCLPRIERTTASLPSPSGCVSPNGDATAGQPTDDSTEEDGDRSDPIDGVSGRIAASDQLTPDAIGEDRRRFREADGGTEAGRLPSVRRTALADLSEAR